MERYNTIKSIGSGATSEVFLVEDKRSHRPYILKQMPTNGMSDQERARAKQEINVLQKIDHPNVVRYRESFITHDSICIVMEQCASSLEVIIDRKREEIESGQGGGQPFPTALLLEWMAELISAVHYLHTHHIIHRDIKPSNIFVTDNNHLKLGDFGVCKVIRQQNEARKSLAQHPHPTTGGTLSSYIISSQGAMLGTPLYLSPEIFEEEIPEYSEGSDVWALGAVFYEMCALHPPFEADNFFALIHRISSGVPPAPFTNGVDKRFERIVAAMMRRDPKQRPTTQSLIDQYVMVPPTHPSHPSQRPGHGRFIQKHHGLAMDTSTSTSGRGDDSGNTSALDASRADADESFTNVQSESKSSTPPNTTPTPPKISSSERRANDSSSDGADDLPPAHGVAAVVRPSISPTSKTSTSPPANTKATPSATPNVRVAVPKKAASPLQNTTSDKKAKHPNATPLPRDASLLGQEDHEEALRRIRGAKSKIDVASIRKHMLQRRADALDASARSDNSLCSPGDIPTSVLCPVASRERSAPSTEAAASAMAAASTSPRRVSPSSSPKFSQSKSSAYTDPLSPPSLSSPPIMPSRVPFNVTTLGTTVQSFLENYGNTVSLEDLDEVAMLLNQYKLRRFGVY
ncbi:protein kinase, putative [Bodo saltans]|uniref:Protein kinase, putative n=1 Tax=Bodo saltans TaxID=75058 RepID=A0A0S4KI08_BODSA|nr:protein kinase, putative [Bodo saltans]|eukprot:CUI12356.1 protein kinase, putative [Bodo saltans]